MVDDPIYRGGGPNILMRCISILEGKELMEEIHSGVCGNHAASKTLVGKGSIGL